MNFAYILQVVWQITVHGASLTKGETVFLTQFLVFFFSFPFPLYSTCRSLIALFHFFFFLKLHKNIHSTVIYAYIRILYCIRKANRNLELTALQWSPTLSDPALSMHYVLHCPDREHHKLSVVQNEYSDMRRVL